MTDLVACLSSGKGTWGHVGRLIADHEWGNVYLITDEFGRENFKTEKGNIHIVMINEMQGLQELAEQIRAALEGKLSGDVAINFISGSGKEHMALLSAMLRLGAGIRLIAVTKDGISEI